MGNSKQNKVELEVVLKPVRKLFYSNENNFGVYACELVNDKNGSGEQDNGANNQVNIKLNDYGNFVINGILPILNEREHYKARLIEKAHKKYGLSYEITSIYQDMPTTISEQIPYLKTILTERQVQSIEEIYPNQDVIKMFMEDTFNYNKVNGFGEKTYKRIKEKIIENLEIKDALVELSQYGVTYTIIAKLMQHYNSARLIVEKMKENPYILLEVDGIGFRKCDDYALKMGIAKDSPYRINACITHILSEAENEGHSWLNKGQVIRNTEALLEIKGAIIREFIDSLELNHKDAQDYYVDNDRIALSRNHFFESEIAEHLKRLLNGNSGNQDNKLNVIDIQNKENKIKEVEIEQGFEFTDEQRKAIEMTVEKNVVVINGRAGTGKAQPLDSKIMTEHGFKRMGDIKIGDRVFGEDGNIHNVIGVFPQGEKDVYEITFNDGSVTHTCKEHLWYVRRQRGFFVTELSSIIQDSLYTYKKDKNNKNGKSKAWKYQIPLTNPLNLQTKDVPLNPYLLGFLIGDGTLGGGSVLVSINQDEEDIISKITELVNDEGFKINRSDNRCTYRINSKSSKYNLYIQNIIKDMGLNVGSEKRFIPNDYKYNDIDTRLKILQGLMDSDGTIDNGAYSFSTSSKTLANDVVFLVQSLGGTATLKVRENTFYYNKLNEKVFCKKSYHLYIKINKKIHTSKKHESKLKAKKTGLFRSIREIKYVGKQQCQCISVDNPSHLYLTDDLIVTHNTAILKGVLNVLRGYSYETCALSGKASQRIIESTGMRSKTIHRLLGYNPNLGFTYDEYSPLETDIIVLDEGSMVNNYIFYRLISAIKTGAKFIILGDTAQLEPIGAGNVLYDIIKSGNIPNVTLTKVHRQAQKSGILTSANAIREGCQINGKDEYENRVIGELEDLHLRPYQSAENVFKQVVNICKHYVGGDLLEFQVIVPMKERGLISTKRLNLELQEIFNPDIKPSLSKGDYNFKEGDKVIQRGNNYTDNVFNGTIGFVKNINTYEKTITINFVGVKVVTYTSDEMKQIDMAYALTAHSTQGSQWNNTIVALDYSAFVLLSRQLVYTALTRASKMCMLVVENKALRYAVTNDASSKRNTFLLEFLS